MDTPFDAQIDQLLAEYQKRREDMVDVQRKVGEVSVTVTAPRRVVEITVNGQGAVTGFLFPSAAYKRLAAADLSAIVMKTLAEARNKAMNSVGELLAPLMPAGLNPIDVAKGTIDWGGVDFEKMVVPDIVREYVNDPR